jgi:hypothetical protein
LLKIGRGTGAVELPDDLNGLAAIFVMLVFAFLIFWTLAKLDVVIPYVRKHKWVALLPVVGLVAIIEGMVAYHDQDIDSDLFLSLQKGRMASIEKLVTSGTDINQRSGNN